MNCGYVFLKTKKIEQGKKVEIEYYPAQDSNDMERTWVRSYNNQTVTLNISEGVYVENAMTNNKHVLTIFSFNSEKDGNYAVRCTTSLISDGVKVILPGDYIEKMLIDTCPIVKLPSGSIPPHIFLFIIHHSCGRGQGAVF